MQLNNEECFSNSLAAERDENILSELDFAHAVLDSLEEPIVACDAKGAVRLINPAARALMEHGAETAAAPNGTEPSRPCHGREPALTTQGGINLFHALNEHRAGHAEFVLKAPFNNGAALIANARVVRDSSGDLVGAVANLRAVTEERLIREANRKLATERDALILRLQLQIERMPLAYILFDTGFRIIDWNSTAERLFGYSKEEVLRLERPLDSILPPDWKQQPAEIDYRFQWEQIASHSVCDSVTKDGRSISCEWFNTSLIDEDGRFGGMFCLVQDVTERKNLEEQLCQSQKMEAIGRLAGGIAHDFNNLLTLIIGYSDILLSSCNANAEKGMLEEVNRAGHRAASLTRQLLAFSRKQVFAPGVVNLNEVVRDTEKLLRRVIGEDIELVTTLAPNLDNVEADPGQLEQVLLNLAVNARDAMPQGGRLLILTENTELERGSDKFGSLIPPGSYVRLNITDTGEGMSNETMRRIFEPFFTTKAPEKGTGLGLAIVDRVVKESHGHIDVNSQEGRGTCFSVYLPRVELGVSSTTPTGEARLMPSGAETILLVEDEEKVRGFARAVLDSCGYRVLEAVSGGEAMQICSNHAGPVQLLVTDVVLPGIGGRSLAEQLGERNPGMSVLFTSGYLDDAVMRHGILKDEVAFLAKPYSPVALAEKVREVLDSKKSL